MAQWSSAQFIVNASVVLTPLTLVNKGEVKARSVNPDQSVNGVKEVNIMCIMAHVANAPQV